MSEELWGMWPSCAMVLSFCLERRGFPDASGCGEGVGVLKDGGRSSSNPSGHVIVTVFFLFGEMVD